MLLANLETVFSPNLLADDILNGSVSKQGLRNITGEGNEVHVEEGFSTNTHHHFGGVTDYSGRDKYATDYSGRDQYATDFSGRHHYGGNTGGL